MRGAGGDPSLVGGVVGRGGAFLRACYEQSGQGEEARAVCKAEAVWTPGQGPSLVGARHLQLLAQNSLCHGPAIHQRHSQDAEILPELRLVPILHCSGIVLIICIFLQQLFLVGFVPVVIFHWDKETHR